MFRGGMCKMLNTYNEVKVAQGINNKNRLDEYS